METDQNPRYQYRADGLSPFDYLDPRFDIHFRRFKQERARGRAANPFIEVLIAIEFSMGEAELTTRLGVDPRTCETLEDVEQRLTAPLFLAPDSIGVLGIDSAGRLVDAELWPTHRHDLQDLIFRARIRFPEDAEQAAFKSTYGPGGAARMEIPASPRQALHFATRAIGLGAEPAIAGQAESVHETGRGIIFGAIDFGCDFAHPHFADPNGATRFLKFWDQNAGPFDGDHAGAGAGDAGNAAPSPAPPTIFGSRDLAIGREFDRSDIDRALLARDPYDALGYAPLTNLGRGSNMDTGAHGMHVLDCGCGNGASVGGAVGVAPDADIVFVHAAPDAFGGAGGNLSVILGALYVARIAQAANKPAVLNISLSSMMGPHDGSTLTDRVLNKLLQGSSPIRAITVSSGNYGDHQQNSGKLHLETRVRPGAARPRTAIWRMPGARAQDIGKAEVAEMELWQAADAPPIKVAVRWPDGRTTPFVTSGETLTIEDAEGRVVGDIYGDRVFRSFGAENPNSRRVYIRRMAEAMDVDWTILIVADAPADAKARPKPFPVDIWVERNDLLQSYLLHKKRRQTGTLNGLACASEVLCVGAFDPRHEQLPAAGFSSRGPARPSKDPNKLQKPDISAPGVRVVSATAQGVWRQKHGAVRAAASTAMWGTSFAAPIVAGVCALMLEANPALTAKAVADIVRQSLRPGDAAGWTPQLGAGRIDARRAVALAKAARS